MLDQLFFGVFPYVAVVLAVSISIYRFVFDRYSYTSLSSEFLEREALFWGSVHFHYAIILILTAHLLAALFPGLWRLLLGSVTRVYILEITGYVLGVYVIIGLIAFIIRRIVHPRVKIVTNNGDRILLFLLLLQAVSGVYMAVAYRWGGTWYLDTAVPWLWSLAKLNPQIKYLVPLPWLVKFHIINAFVLIAYFPFTRLVHFVTVPLWYIWRPYQVVIWNRSQR